MSQTPHERVVTCTKDVWVFKENQQHCVENTGPCKGLEPPLISFYLAREMRGSMIYQNIQHKKQFVKFE